MRQGRHNVLSLPFRWVKTSDSICETLRKGIYSCLTCGKKKFSLIRISYRDNQICSQGCSSVNTGIGACNAIFVSELLNQSFKLLVSIHLYISGFLTLQCFQVWFLYSRNQQPCFYIRFSTLFLYFLGFLIRSLQSYFCFYITHLCFWFLQPDSSVLTSALFLYTLGSNALALYPIVLPFTFFLFTLGFYNPPLYSSVLTSKI